MKRSVTLLLSAGIVLSACRTEPAPEPRPDPTPPQPQTQVTTASAPGAAAAAPAGGGGMRVASVPVSPGDPMQGKFTLEDATKGLPGSGYSDLTATIDTSHGKLTCKLFADKAPITVANFVGLARGMRPWKDPNTNQWVTKPAYDGTSFHRIIKGFMIQGGDAKGNGTGEPGYVIPDEIWQGATHDHAGELCMANRGPNTNGAQFFITDAAAPHLDRGYTIFGECAPEAVVHMIAGVQTAPGDRPTSPVTIRKVTIARGAGVPSAGAPRDAGRD